MASMRELFLVYLGDLLHSLNLPEGIRHTKSISSKVAEMVQEESDSLIVPMKPVTPAEGRGGHTNRSVERNICHTGGGGKDGK